MALDMCGAATGAVSFFCCSVYMSSLVTGSVLGKLPHVRNALQTNGAVRSIVRKKAATCLLRLIRKSPAEAEILQPDVWSVKLVRCHPLFVTPDVLAQAAGQETRAT